MIRYIVAESVWCIPCLIQNSLTIFEILVLNTCVRRWNKHLVCSFRGVKDERRVGREGDWVHECKGIRKGGGPRQEST